MIDALSIWAHNLPIETEGNKQMSITNGVIVPDLPHHCGSWIVVDRETHVAVLETFQRSVAESINQERYEVLTALDYLSNLTVKG